MGGTGDGSSWASPTNSIQGAVNAASGGETILVSNGTYNITAEIAVSKAVTIRSFGNGVTGGLANAASTILARGSGRWNFYITAATTVDGFTGTGASAANQVGANFYVSAGATVKNCILRDNTTGFPGSHPAGHMVSGGVSNCLIYGNTQGGRQHDAGAFRMDGGTMVACQIYNNYMTSQGTGGGGGVWVNGSGATLRNCLLYGNDALYVAGGVGNGGAVYLSVGTVENCTIVGKNAASGGGNYRAGGTVRNCIVYNNTALDANKNIVNADANVTCTCTTNPVSSGTGCISGDPVFTNGYQLAISPVKSPCYNAGTNQVWMTNAVDLAGNPRIKGSRVDMGAYEAPAPEIGVAQAGVELFSGVSTSQFASVYVGYSGVAMTYVVTNSGDASLALSGVSRGGGEGSNDFSVVTSGMAASLAAGSSTWFTATFEPTTSGVRTASLTIANDDYDESAFTIGLTGPGVDHPLGPFGATNATEVGADLHLELHGKAGRTYRILSSNDAANIHTVVCTTNPPTAAFTFIDPGVVGNAAVTGLYYQIAESNSAGAWTPNPLVWALENRHNIGSNKWHLLTVPVEYGDTNQNTLAGELGRQLAGGLIPGSSEPTAPNIWLQNYTGNAWTNFWLNTNRTWYAGADPAVVTIEPGRGFWLKSQPTDSSASNTVLIGLTPTNSMPVQMITNRWMLFAWPYAAPGLESAWGFQGGKGGSSFDNADNIFMQYNGRSYLLWLRSSDNSWCIQNTTNRVSDLSLNNRSAYFYYARKTNFWWCRTLNAERRTSK